MADIKPIKCNCDLKASSFTIKQENNPNKGQLAWGCGKKWKEDGRCKFFLLDRDAANRPYDAPPKCSECGQVCNRFQVKKEDSPNKGKYFFVCPAKSQGSQKHTWMLEEQWIKECSGQKTVSAYFNKGGKRKVGDSEPSWSPALEELRAAVNEEVKKGGTTRYALARIGDQDDPSKWFDLSTDATAAYSIAREAAFREIAGCNHGHFVLSTQKMQLDALKKVQPQRSTDELLKIACLKIVEVPLSEDKEPEEKAAKRPRLAWEKAVEIAFDRECAFAQLADVIGGEDGMIKAKALHGDKTTKEIIELVNASH